LAVRRLVGRRHLGDQGPQIKVKPAIERTLGGIAIDRGQRKPGNDQDHHDPDGRGQEEPGGQRTPAHQAAALNGGCPARDLMKWCQP